MIKEKKNVEPTADSAFFYYIKVTNRAMAAGNS